MTNPIAEFSGTTLEKTYLWGMDLSGFIQGAGGVGGLLAVKEGANHYYPTFDGNGNVSEYLNSSGVPVAHYEYDAFGRTATEPTGTKANDFAHRFSTKFFDSESGFYYYGYRFYDPVTGRWPSRDRIAESGESNIYNFVGNSGIDRIDVLGMVRGQNWVHLISEDYKPGDNHDLMWDRLWGRGKIHNNTQNLDLPVEEKDKGKAEAVTKLDSEVHWYVDSACCVWITAKYIVEGIWIGKELSNSYWGIAAHELQHVRGGHERVKGIVELFNSLPQPCTKTKESARAAAEERSKKVELHIKAAFTHEYNHSQKGDHSTPKESEEIDWDGNYGR